MSANPQNFHVGTWPLQSTGSTDEYITDNFSPSNSGSSVIPLSNDKWNQAHAHDDVSLNSDEDDLFKSNSHDGEEQRPNSDEDDLFSASSGKGDPAVPHDSDGDDLTASYPHNSDEDDLFPSSAGDEQDHDIDDDVRSSDMTSVARAEQPKQHLYANDSSDNSHFSTDCPPNDCGLKRAGSSKQEMDRRKEIQNRQGTKDNGGDDDEEEGDERDNDDDDSDSDNEMGGDDSDDNDDDDEEEVEEESEGSDDDDDDNDDEDKWGRCTNCNEEGLRGTCCDDCEDMQQYFTN